MLKLKLKLQYFVHLMPRADSFEKTPMLGKIEGRIYAEYIMRNAGLEEAQARIKIARRNINNLRYADDTTLMAESDVVCGSMN